MVLLMSYSGGGGNLAGPVLGAILITYLQVMLSDATEVCQLYFGLLFIGMIMFAPGGIAGLLMMHQPLWRARVLHRVIPAYLLALVAGLVTLAGVCLAIEMTFRLTVRASEGSAMSYLHVPLDARSPLPWLVAALLGARGFWVFPRTPRLAAPPLRAAPPHAPPA